jgi:hypothetical protein
VFGRHCWDQLESTRPLPAGGTGPAAGAQQDPDYPETICASVTGGDGRSLREYLLESLRSDRHRPWRQSPPLPAQRAMRRRASSRHSCCNTVAGGPVPVDWTAAELQRGWVRQDLAVLQPGRAPAASRPAYRCEHCGFAGKHLHWVPQLQALGQYHGHRGFQLGPRHSLKHTWIHRL